MSRLARRALLAAAATAVASAQAATEGPAIHETVQYHDVEGASADALLASLKDLSYARASDDHFAAANTKWQLRWNVTMQPGKDGCRLASATTTIDIAMNLPRWTPPANAEPSLVKSWETFAAAVRKHEDGHHEIAIAAVREVDRRLREPRTARSCGALQKQLRGVAEEVVKAYREKDDSYDVTTMHGRTQGVVFP